jgi:hypothetical protein
MDNRHEVFAVEDHISISLGQTRQTGYQWIFLTGYGIARFLSQLAAGQVGTREPTLVMRSTCLISTSRQTGLLLFSLDALSPPWCLDPASANVTALFSILDAVHVDSRHSTTFHFPEKLARTALGRAINISLVPSGRP